LEEWAKAVASRIFRTFGAEACSESLLFLDRLDLTG